ncbi:MAG: VOC family protein [Pseudobdellovibrionaceae bacterium]|nr:VOC family protein [Pseudobdellovibrionaceae bacterium]
MTGALINIDVSDIKQATAFYCEVFGLRVGRRFDQEFVELLGFGVPCYLLQKKPGTASIPGGSHTRDYARHWTPVHLDVVTEDIQAAYQRALTAGARSESDIKTTPYGKLVLMSDPFGHGFCLIEFNEKGYDALIPNATI